MGARRQSAKGRRSPRAGGPSLRHAPCVGPFPFRSLIRRLRDYPSSYSPVHRDPHPALVSRRPVLGPFHGGGVHRRGRQHCDAMDGPLVSGPPGNHVPDLVLVPAPSPSDERRALSRPGRVVERLHCPGNVWRVLVDDSKTLSFQRAMPLRLSGPQGSVRNPRPRRAVHRGRHVHTCRRPSADCSARVLRVLRVATPPQDCGWPFSENGLIAARREGWWHTSAWRGAPSRPGGYTSPVRLEARPHGAERALSSKLEGVFR